MREFNTSFQENVIEDPSADVRFTIEVQWDDAGTELVYFLSHSDSGVPVGATTIHSIHSISSTSQSLNNRYAIAEIGALTFMLADVDDGITTELASRFADDKTVVRKKCTVYAGTSGMDWTDYAPIDTWYLDDVSHTGPGYKFRASDIQRFLRQKIFTPDKTRLSASMTAAQNYVPVTLALSSTKFPTVTHDANYTYNASTTVGYFKIDDEIIAHDGNLTNSVDGPAYGVVERGALDTVAAAHKTDDNADEEKGKEVEEVIYVEAKVVDLIHLIMTGEDIAGSATIPDHWNAEVDTSFIESTSFSNINAELSDRRMRFIGEKGRDAKQFVEQQLQRFYGLYQTVTSQGKFKLNRYDRTIEEASQVANIVDRQLSDVGNLDQRSQDVINVYSIDYNYDYLSERHTRNLTFLDSASFNANGGHIKNESFEFRGVHTALHTDNDVRNFIYQTRELYSNPPYKFKVSGFHELLGIEVGDVVNVNTSIRKNYVEGTTTLDRPFLVSRRSIDFGSREISLELIGSGLSANAILDPGAAGSTGELDTSFFTGTGTDLETLTNISSGQLTGDVTLTGTSDITAAASIWNLDGNLVVPDGMTLTIENNVQIRVTGTIAVQNGGTITGAGNGLVGATFGNAASAGYFGASKAGVGEQQAPSTFWHKTPNNGGVIKNLPDKAVSQGEVSEIPFFNLRNEDGTLTGLPSDLRGTPGNPGGAIGSPGTGNGGDGGNSSAGLITISRGMSIGATGTVDVSGTDGTAGATDTVSTPSGNITLYGGGGAGGTASGFLCIIDGDFTGPTSDQVTANRGNSPWPSPRDHLRTGFDSKDMSGAAYRLQYVPARKAVEDSGETGTRQLDTPSGLTLANGEAIGHEDGTISEFIHATWTPLNDSAVTFYQLRAKRSADAASKYRFVGVVPEDEASEGLLIPADFGVQYDVQIRAYGNNVTVSDWSSAETHTVTSQVAAPSDVTGFKVSQNGALVNFFWKLITDENRDGYIIRYGASGVTWENATPLLDETKGTKVTTAYVPNGTWDFLIKAINLQKKLSDNAARDTLTVLGLLDIIDETEHSPEWSGTLTGYWNHYNNKLVPLDQNAASTYGYEMFDDVVPTPVAESSYETAEIDSGVEAVVRISASIESELARDTTGIADPTLQVDYRADGGSYDGFEDWEVAEVTARYAKFKLVNDNTEGVALISGFNTILDAQEREEKDTNVTVAPGGTVITFDQAFRLDPFIEVGSIGSGGLIAESANDATTGFTFHIYDSGGASVGGTGKWKAVGV